ncbi:glycine-rich protein 1-like [Osmerus eperlanus]|uniref:glycine-rich protein 1-like n=1 Tax=Osmerus eperlanus TaxID=29151 RepID=UPI002E0E92F5
MTDARCPIALPELAALMSEACEQSLKSTQKMSAPEELKIVVLGKTGSGKSSVGNTLLHNNCFTSKCSPVAVTGEVNRANGIVCGRKVTIIDTPGIFDPNRSKKDLRYEIVSCLTECAPGPHAFLLVFPVGRFTPEYMKTAKTIQDWFSKDLLKHTVVLFTHGDNLDDQMTIQQFLDLDNSCQGDKKNKTNVFKRFLESCGRVHVIDNKYWKSDEGYKNNSFHISQLMTTIDVMVRKNEGKHYNNETLETIAKAIDTEVKNIKKELEEAGETQDIEITEIKQRARNRVKKEALRKLAGISTGALLGMLLGVAVGATAPLILLAGLCAAGGTKIAMEVKSSKSAACGAAVYTTIVEATAGAIATSWAAEGAAAAGAAAAGAAAAGATAAGATAAGATAAGATAAGAAVASAEGAVAAEAAAAAGVVAGGIGAGAAAGIGLGVAGGVCGVAGAVKGGMKGAEAAKRSDNAKEAAKNAAQSVGDEAKKIIQGAWEAPQKLVKPKES